MRRAPIAAKFLFNIARPFPLARIGAEHEGGVRLPVTDDLDPRDRRLTGRAPGFGEVATRRDELVVLGGMA